MKKKIVIIISFFIFFSFNSHALIEVDITRGNLNPLPVAVSPLFIDSTSQNKISKELGNLNIGLEISAIIENNLKKTGLFNPLNQDAFIQKPDIAHLKPRFEDWQLIKAQALVTGKVELVDGLSGSENIYVSNLLPGVKISTERHLGQKCERCWHYFDVDSETGDTMNCQRCQDHMKVAEESN